MVKRARIPRTNQMLSVFKQQIQKSDWKIVRTLRIDQNRWKIFLRDSITGKTKQAVIDKSDMRSLRKFKSVIRHQV